jgi:hypothetical protein
MCCNLNGSFSMTLSGPKYANAKLSAVLILIIDGWTIFLLVSWQGDRVKTSEKNFISGICYIAYLYVEMLLSNGAVVQHFL